METNGNLPGDGDGNKRLPGRPVSSSERPSLLGEPPSASSSVSSNHSATGNKKGTKKNGTANVNQNLQSKNGGKKHQVYKSKVYYSDAQAEEDWRKPSYKSNKSGSADGQQFNKGGHQGSWSGKGSKPVGAGGGHKFNASRAASASKLPGTGTSTTNGNAVTHMTKEEMIKSLKEKFLTNSFPPPPPAQLAPMAFQNVPTSDPEPPAAVSVAATAITSVGNETADFGGNDSDSTFNPTRDWINELSESIMRAWKFGKVEPTPPTSVSTPLQNGFAPGKIDKLKIDDIQIPNRKETSPPLAPELAQPEMPNASITAFMVNVTPDSPHSSQPRKQDALKVQPTMTASTSSTSGNVFTAGALDDTRGLSMKEVLAAYKQKRDEDFQKQQAANEQLKAKINAPRNVFNRKKVPRSILEQTRSLPIYARKDELIELVKKNQFIIVIGETGSGKSTQLPQYLVEAGLHGNGQIGVTQPRRVAARSLAERVSLECGVKMGTTVGYAVRFEKKVSGETVIKYLTDGLLVKECSTEARLDSYSIIIIDEAHERSIHTDVCFGLLKRAARLRKDLKVIISSATLEHEKFSKYFNGAPVFNVSGKGFEVENIYEPKTEYDYMQGAVDRIVRINRGMPRGKEKGDILVFLSGQDEIEQLWDLLDVKIAELGSNSLYDDLMVVPCYGALPFEDQQKIFIDTPQNTRKVVLATNIAETSVTIDGIVYVIDCGFFKQNEYNPRSGIYSLKKKRITKFQAIQRAGRAGRTRPGKCYRLYSKYEFDQMTNATSPDITRCNVESVILDIISMGIPDPLKFEFMDPPPAEAMMEGIIHLQELGALDEDTKLTYVGKRMSEFPLDPPLAKVVLESERLGCSAEVLKIVALLSTQCNHLFVRGKRIGNTADMFKAKYNHPDGDLLTLLQVYNAWLINGMKEDWCRSQYIQYRILAEAEEIRTQLTEILKYCRARGISQASPRGRLYPTADLHENIRRAFTAGYFKQVARKPPGRGYGFQVPGSQSWNLEKVFMHPSSCMFHTTQTWVIYHELMTTKKPYMREVIAINPAWIKEYAPEYVRKMEKYGVLFV